MREPGGDQPLAVRPHQVKNAVAVGRTGDRVDLVRIGTGESARWQLAGNTFGLRTRSMVPLFDRGRWRGHEPNDLRRLEPNQITALEFELMLVIGSYLGALPQP